MAAWAAVAGALVLMVSPAVPLGFGSGPGAFYNAPIWLWTLGGAGAIGLSVARSDRWLGAAIVVFAVSALPHHLDAAASQAIWFAFGAGALGLLVRWLPRDSAPVLRWGLLTAAGVQVAYMALQLLALDPVWHFPREYLAGTFGNPRYVGALLAVTAPLTPWWLLPVVGVALGLSGSYLAILAAAGGLVVRWAGTRRRIAALAMAGLIGVGLTLSWSRGNTTFGSAVFRAGTWAAMGQDFVAGGPWVWLMGRGPAGFLTRMWPLQAQALNEISAQAHSDVLQWIYETGLVGAVVLAGWLRAFGTDLRRAAPAWQGAVTALAVLTAGLHVFHLPALAPVGILALAGVVRRT